MFSCRCGFVADVLKKRRTASFDLNPPFLTLITTVAVIQASSRVSSLALSHAIANESNCNLLLCDLPFALSTIVVRVGQAPDADGDCVTYRWQLTTFRPA